MNAIYTGKFSSDRTIDEYASQIWNVKKYEIQAGVPEALKEQIVE